MVGRLDPSAEDGLLLSAPGRSRRGPCLRAAAVDASTRLTVTAGGQGVVVHR